MERTEALKILKDMHDTALFSVRTALETLIPELQEREDERIRKEMIAFLKSEKAFKIIDLPISERWIAYLEKQKTSEEAIKYVKENHSPDEVSDFQAAMNIAVAKAYDKGVQDTLKKQKEQPKEELVYRLNGLMQDYIREGKDEEEREYRYKCYELFWDALEDANSFEQKEQKPAAPTNVPPIPSKNNEQKPAEEDSSEKDLAECYLSKFDKKFPILPTLKGKQLANYKNFLNTCQQIFGLKEWGIHPTQAKLFAKLTLLWASWGAEHLQGIGAIEGDNEMDEILQKEQKPVILGPDETEFPYNHPANTLEGEIKNIWSKLSSENAFVASFEGFREVILHFVNFVQQEQKPAEWSETEKARIDRIVDVLDWAESKGRISYSDWEDYVCYVNSLKPQPKQEWSEEDEKKIANIIMVLMSSPIEYAEEIEFLKSLRLRPSWKPSEEQMKVMKEVVFYFGDSWVSHKQEVLESLYNDLKKL